MNSELVRPIVYELMQTGGRVGGQMLAHLRTPLPVLNLDAANKDYLDGISPSAGQVIDSIQVPYLPDGILDWHSGLTRIATGAFPLLRGLTYIMPLFAGDESMSWNTIGVDVSTAGASSSVRLGVVALDHTTNLAPTALLIDAGTVSTATTGEKTVAISLATTNRMLGIAMQAEGSDTPPELLATPASNPDAFVPWFGFSEPSPAGLPSYCLCSNSIVSDGSFDLDVTHYYHRVDQLSPVGFLRRSA